VCVCVCLCITHKCNKVGDETYSTLVVCGSFSVPGHVFYGGTVVGESAMTYLEDIGPEVIHGYEVNIV